MSETEKAPAPKTLVRKLAEVMGLVDRIPKTGRNDFHKYDYATEADIVQSVRKGMAERGVVLVPSITKIEWSEIAGGKQKIATLTVLFTFLDGDSGEKIEFTGMGQGADASDKAIYKAMTGAEKYALMKFFLIPTGDDPEQDTKPTPGPIRAPVHASAKTAQVKAQLAAQRPAGIIDVKPGESEAQAEARAKGPGPTPWERIRIMAGEYGLTSEHIAAVVKSATGKQSREQVTAEDVAKVRSAIEAIKH